MNISDIDIKNEIGDSDTQYELGRYYYKEQNINKAIELYTSSANLGNTNAQYSLGRCYEKGIGVEKNIDKAVELYTIASDLGNTNAQCSLGNYYYRNGKKNLQKAFELY